MTTISRRGLLALAASAALSTVPLPTFAQSASPDGWRPPSVPLVAHDPYFSIWSPADALTDKDTCHWTGRPQPLTSLVRIDGKAYRIMGAQPAAIPVLPQTGLEVTPTHTIYTFGNAEVTVTLTFMTPALPEDVEVISRPVTYVTMNVTSRDGKSHRVEWYLEAAPEIAVNEARQVVTGEKLNAGDLTLVRTGTVDQPVLSKRGDDLRIDWGYAYLAAPRGRNGADVGFVQRSTGRDAWATSGKLSTVSAATGAPASDAPALALNFSLGSVGAQGASREAMIAYDDLYSVTYMGRKLRPYWRRKGTDMPALLQVAAREHDALHRRCVQFDKELVADLQRVGGDKYARIATLAHRQAFAANKIVADANGAPLMFSKENFSNGCMGTVDILYPAAPQLLVLSPTLAKASLVAIMNYAVSPRWKFPFAPHDLGTYPRGDGQVYGGGERTEENQMPVEETGNMLIMLAAVAVMDGNSKFSDPFWPLLTRWAKYLEEKGFDPENQLCTDDFAGHLAHNVNLSAKAIEALGSYSILCRMRGDSREADRVYSVAKGMAARWVKEGRDGDHYRLAFDRENTWSQKYNLVWDRILNLNLFPASVMQDEMAFYKKNINRFGIPLDNRQPYTKLDWTVWTGTLTGNKADFETLVAPSYTFLSSTPDRNPMSDWHQTREPRQVGFQARAVVGGVFLPLMTDRATWTKWAKRDRTNAATLPSWAPLPIPPKATEIVATSEKNGQEWRYTFDKPAENFYAPAFNDSTWKTGQGGFGTKDTPNTSVRTEWNTPDIWARRTFDLPSGANVNNLKLWVFHDEDAEIFINGVPAARLGGYVTTYDEVQISPAARASLKPGKNLIAVHCHQTTGGQYLDLGLVTIEE